jgi:pyruvate dehydrogenase E2 component (dihydrolipoamide acetyltransferase)
MPQKGLTEESAILTKWYVKEGDVVKEGQYIFALETGKATFDVEAEVSGTILKLAGGEGEEIAIKAVVCVIGTPGESYTLEEKPSVAAAGTSSAPAAAAPDLPVKGAAGEAAPLTAGGTGEVKISPRARRLAEKEGLDYSALRGSGPGGRIIEDDIKAVPAGRKAPDSSRPAMTASFFPAGTEGEYAVVPNDRMRKIIALNMLNSLQSMAQFTMTASFDAAEIMDYHVRYNSVHSPEEKLSINDLLVFAVSRVLPDFPFMNAHFSGEETRLFTHVSLGIATHTPKGLLVPTVKNADTKSLGEISGEIKALALRCREGKALPEDLSGGTFTVSNLGRYGVNFFTPIINPPQTGILGVGAIEYKRKKTPSGIADYPAMGLSLTVDHRAVDGAPAAEFLAALCAELENFSFLLVK